MTSVNDTFNDDVSSSEVRIHTGMELSEGIQSCDASPSKCSSNNINDKNVDSNGKMSNGDGENPKEQANPRMGFKRKLCEVESVVDNSSNPSSKRHKKDSIKTNDNSYEFEEISGCLNSSHGLNDQKQSLMDWTGSSLAEVDAVEPNLGVGENCQQTSWESRAQTSVKPKAAITHDTAGNLLNAEYSAENCELNAPMTAIGRADESVHSQRLNADENISPDSGRHSILSIPPSGVRPLFTCQSGIECSEIFIENGNAGVSVPNSTRDGKTSSSHTGLQSMSSCLSNITALEVGSSGRGMWKSEIEIEAQSTAHDGGSWMSSSKQAEVIQDKPMSHDLQEKCVRKCSQLNWFHGESNPMALAEHQTFVKYEETDGETSSRADQASPHFEWSAMHSSSGSRGRFSFQKLIAGEYCYREDDEEDKKSEENDKEEEESISMPISHCPKREDAAESVVSEKCRSKASSLKTYKPNNCFGGHYQDCDSYPPSLGTNQICENMSGEPQCIQGQLDMHKDHMEAPLLPSSDYRLSDTAAANLPFYGGEYIGAATNQTAQYQSPIRDINVIDNQLLHNHKPVKLKIKMPQERTFSQDCLPSNILPKERSSNPVHPSSAKMLLSTGLLDGRSVRYLYRGGEVSLSGTIQKEGILCGCGVCNGQEVVNISSFEKHSGSTAKHPSDFIFFENGRSLREVLEVCRNIPVDEIPAAICKALDSVSCERLNACRQCGEPTGLSRQVKFSQTCSKCTSSLCRQSKLHGKSIAQASYAKSQPHARVLGPKAKRGRPPAAASGLKVHGKPIVQTRHSDSVPVKTKRGRETNLHKLIFMPNGLADGTKLAYYVKGQCCLDGYKQESGICCSCCNQVVSCSVFEAHAGWGSRRAPYQNIYLSDGQSLHEVAISLASQKRLTERKNCSPSDNEDFCTECEDGGELLLCDGCPKAFHTDCLGMSDLPDGDWYCPYCRGAFRTGRKALGKVPEVAGKTGCLVSKERPSNRCTRVVKAAENTIGGCVLCRCEDFTKSGFGDRTIMLCDQCEKEFHVGCLRTHGMSDLRELPEGEWFCSDDCTKIHSVLKKSLANGPESLPSDISEVLEKKLVQNGSEKDFRDEIRWQILHGKTRDPDSKALLAEAAAIFHECFDPIVDPTTGRDLIPSMVYSRSIRDQEFGGMYCAVLTVNSVVVSAGLFRIFGCQIAELPLVATSAKYQGQGYFQSLFLCFENMLGLLNVEHLVLPAAEEAASIWTNKFGFTKMSPDQLNKYSKDLQIMVFKGSSMLEKALPRSSSIHGTQNMAA